MLKKGWSRRDDGGCRLWCGEWERNVMFERNKLENSAGGVRSAIPFAIFSDSPFERVGI